MYSILIADDEPLTRKALDIIISRIEGFKVVYSVSTGEEAVNICKNNNIDIVFIDMMMPGESGIECSKKIYSYNPNITIFIVSSYNNFDFEIDDLNTKVKSYVSKPILFSKIENLLNKFKKENLSKKQSYNLKKFEFNNLFLIIHDKNFKKAYDEIPKIVEEVYISNNNDIALIKQSFIDLGQKLINSTEVLEENHKKVTELFSIKGFCVNHKRFFELWLYQIVNYVFQENSIKKYEILKSVFDYIDKNLEEKIGLNEIINSCLVSQGYLSRIFKREFKVSVMDYLHMRKIYLAKTYFCFTESNITDVAFKLGYNESGYFGKVFKKYEKITVNKYKKSCKVSI